MKKLYFLRHGLTEMNIAGLSAGHTETALTEEGRAQAREAGKSARDIPFDLIVCSPMSRAIDTAKIFAEAAGMSLDKLVINDLFIERFYGEQEGKPHISDYSLLENVPGFENDDALVARAQKALDWLNEQDADQILVVSHASFGRALRSLVKAEYPMSHPEKIKNADLLLFVEEN